MSLERETVMLGALRWRAGFNRYVATVLLVALAGLVLWRTVTPVERVVIRERAIGQMDLPAGVFAERFAAAFLSFDAADPAARERALAEFDGSQLGATAQGYLPPNKGARSVEATAIVRQVTAPGALRFVVAATTRPGGRMFLSVDVRRDARRALQVVGLPAIVGAPLEAGAAPAPGGADVDDTQVTTVVRRALRNYLAGSTDDLAADLMPSAVVSVPTHAMSLVGVQEMHWETGVPTSVLATVTTRDEAGVQLDLVYELALSRRGARWFVAGIHTNPSGH